MNYWSRMKYITGLLVLSFLIDWSFSTPRFPVPCGICNNCRFMISSTNKWDPCGKDRTNKDEYCTSLLATLAEFGTFYSLNVDGENFIVVLGNNVDRKLEQNELILTNIYYYFGDVDDYENEYALVNLDAENAHIESPYRFNIFDINFQCYHSEGGGVYSLGLVASDDGGWKFLYHCKFTTNMTYMNDGVAQKFAIIYVGANGNVSLTHVSFAGLCGKLNLARFIKYEGGILNLDDVTFGNECEDYFDTSFENTGVTYNDVAEIKYYWNLETINDTASRCYNNTNGIAYVAPTNSGNEVTNDGGTPPTNTSNGPSDGPNESAAPGDESSKSSFPWWIFLILGAVILLLLLLLLLFLKKRKKKTDDEAPDEESGDKVELPEVPPEVPEEDNFSKLKFEYDANYNFAKADVAAVNENFDAFSAALSVSSTASTSMLDLNNNNNDADPPLENCLPVDDAANNAEDKMLVIKEEQTNEGVNTSDTQ